MMRVTLVLLLSLGCAEPALEDVPDAATADATSRPDLPRQPDARPLPDAQLTCRQACLPDEGYCWFGECKPWPTVWWWECEEPSGDGLGCCVGPCLEECRALPAPLGISCGSFCAERCRQVVAP